MSLTKRGTLIGKLIGRVGICLTKKGYVVASWSPTNIRKQLMFAAGEVHINSLAPRFGYKTLRMETLIPVTGGRTQAHCYTVFCNAISNNIVLNILYGQF